MPFLDVSERILNSFKVQTIVMQAARNRVICPFRYVGQFFDEQPSQKTVLPQSLSLFPDSMFLIRHIPSVADFRGSGVSGWWRSVYGLSGDPQSAEKCAFTCSVTHLI